MKPENIFYDEDDFDLSKEAPLLSSMDRKLPFEVPADYFDTLPMLIQEKCAQQNDVKITFIEKIMLILKPTFLALGMLVLLISGGAFFYSHKSSTTVTPYIPTTNDITAALNDNLSQDDESLLIDSLPENSVASNVKTANDQPIVNYLIDNDVDINTIINTQN